MMEDENEMVAMSLVVRLTQQDWQLLADWGNGRHGAGLWTYERCVGEAVDSICEGLRDAEAATQQLERMLDRADRLNTVQTEIAPAPEQVAEVQPGPKQAATILVGFDEEEQPDCALYPVKLDPEDFDRIARYQWELVHATVRDPHTGERNVETVTVYRIDEDNRRIHLQSAILGISHRQIGFLNGDGTDCRKQNLAVIKKGWQP